METKELAKRDGAEVQVKPSDLLQAIARAASDPNVDVSKMERLFEMHAKITAEQQRVAYVEAMARIQEQLKPITKDGRIVVKGTERSRYVKFETLDAYVRPLLAKEGFSFSYDSQSTDGKMFAITCKLSHREGHTETKSIVLPMDRSDFRSDVQSIGSTMSYAKRQLVKMHLNIIETNEDDDGNGGNTTITEDQLQDLNTLIVDTKADLAVFLEYMGVDKLEDIQKKHYDKAMTAMSYRKAHRGKK